MGEDCEGRIGWEGVPNSLTICYNIIEVIKMSRVAKIDENIYSPKCGKHERQVKYGKNKSGSQKYYYNDCKRYYAPAPKQHEYPENSQLKCFSQAHAEDRQVTPWI